MTVLRRSIAKAGVTLLALTGLESSALAHTSERGHIMLLPTELYVLGGAFAVAASILLVALLPFIHRFTPRSVPMDAGAPTALRRNALSLLSLAGLLALLAAGFLGPPDPIANPLPGSIWTLWWSGFTAVTLLIGDIWPAVNPWVGLYSLIRGDTEPPLRLPHWLGQWPAFVLFFCFAWFELIYPIPFDPQRLAIIATAYLLLTFLATVLFGKAWLHRGECFSVYFRMVGRLAFLQWHEAQGRLQVSAVLPGAGLTAVGTQPQGSSAFVLLALSAVSFDGFMRTFFWTEMLGVNPLEYPGRSAMVPANTLGLVAMFLGLACAYWLALWLGRKLAVVGAHPMLVFSIVPIAFAYHLAHYLPEFPVTFLQTAKALGDPLGLGWNLVGWAQIEPPASIMTDYAVAGLVYRIQTAIIVAGHVIAVVVAHAQMARDRERAGAAIWALLPLNVLMVLYTVFGLWLLSTPVVG